MKFSQEDRSEYFGKDLEAMSFANNYHQWIASELQPYLGQSVAEVGAGVGNFSRLLLDAGINSLSAYEPSQNMYPVLEKAMDGENRTQLINGFFTGPETGKTFDSMVYVNVLEHIENDKAELLNAHAALRPGGHLLVFVPALPWLYSDLDKKLGHYRRYLKPNLVMLAQEAGFSVVTAKYFDVAGIIPWYINFVLLRNIIGGKSVSLYDNVVVPVMRPIEKLIPPPIGKNILLVARKDEHLQDNSVSSGS